MAGRPINNVPRQFDDAKLAAMVEPLTVRVEKRKGSSRTPIPLPTAEDGRSPGTDWTKEMVRQLEAWLVNEWSGGGYYEITVTDSSTPSSITMKWEPYFNPTEYPEKTPPPLAEARAATPTPTPTQASPTPLQPLQTLVRPMSNPAFPGGLPPGLPMPQPAAPQPMQFGANYGYNPYAQQYGYPPSPPPWQQAQQQLQQQPSAAAQLEAERRRYEEQTQKLQHELQQAREQQIRQQHEAELQRARAQADEQAKALQQQVTELRNLIANQQTTQARNPELEALREAQRQAEVKYERERMERETERRDAMLRDQMRENMLQTQRQIEAISAQTREMIQAMTANRGEPNALIMAMQETSRQQLQAMKDISQAQAQQFDRMQAMTLRPQDILALTKESASSVDLITERLSRQNERVFEMQTRVMEQALQMQPQGSATADIVRDGLDTVKTAVERYATVQQVKSQVEAQKQVEIARAQADAVGAAAAAQRGAVHTPPPPRIEQQLAAGGLNGVNGHAVPAPGPKRLGRTDVEWFGALMGEVGQLRDGVAHFIESVSMQPVRMDAKTGAPEGVTVAAAAQGIMQAAGFIAANGVKIPAMDELLGQQRYADFMDVLLPDAPQNYRDDVAAVLVQMASTSAGRQVADTSARMVNVEVEEVEGGDDDADDEVDNNAEPVIEAKPVVGQKKGQRHARA